MTDKLFLNWSRIQDPTTRLNNHKRDVVNSIGVFRRLLIAAAQLCPDPFHDSRSYPEGRGGPGLGEPPRGSSSPQSTNGEAIQTLKYSQNSGFTNFCYKISQ